VIGEDLGTVREGFRQRAASTSTNTWRAPRRCPAGSSTSSQEGGRVRRPAEFPELADVSVATHDLATMRGYWAENDIAARAELGMYKSADEERQRGPTARGTSSFFCRRFTKRGCGILAGPSGLRGYPTRSTSISRDRGRKGKADTWPAPTR
jgi:hypothetical protein